MATLAETLAAARAVEEDEPEVEPLLVTTQGFPITSPEIQRHPQTVLTNTGEAFLTQPNASNFAPSPQAVPGSYISLDGSHRGYQYKGGIIRPNVFGQYTPRNADEREVLETLRTSGVLTSVGVGSIYPITI